MREDERALTGHGAGGFGLLMSGFVVAALALFFGLVVSAALGWAVIFSFYIDGD